MMVILTPDIDGKRMAQIGHRLAESKNAPWIAVAVSAPAIVLHTLFDEKKIRDGLALARSLGAESAILSELDTIESILAFAKDNDVAELVVARPTGNWLRRLREGSLAYRLVAASSEIGVRVVDVPTGPEGDGQLSWRIGKGGGWFHEYLASAISVFLAAGVIKIFGLLLERAVSNLSMLMLAAVLYSAVTFGLAPSLFAAVLGVAVYDFFFIDPSLTLSPDLAEDVVNLITFITVAILTSHIAGRLHEQAANAQRRERRTDAMFRLSREVAAAVRFEDVTKAIVDQVNTILQVNSVLILPEEKEETLRVSYPADVRLDDREREAAELAYASGRETGRGTERLSSAERFYLPLQTANGTSGVLGLTIANEDDLTSADFLNLLNALTGIAAVAIERLELANEIERAEVIAKTESLRSALLSSISHDLRTPLASIIGSVSSLISYGDNFDEATKLDLLQTIYEEADRLNRFVGNLLDMTKLESGELVPRSEWVDVDDLIGTALANIRRGFGQGHTIITEIPPGLPLLYIDLALMEQVVVNLLDNAMKYSLPGSTVWIRAHPRPESEPDTICIEVVDQGAGISKQNLTDIFDKFFRIRHRDRRIAGTGLGLAICKGIIEGHGGTIEVESEGEGMGSVFRICLPVRSDQPIVATDDPEEEHVGD